jgi:hypothetical protein
LPSTTLSDAPRSPSTSPIAIPRLSLPETTLRADGVGPPIRFSAPLTKMPVPLGSGAEPAASVPMKFPSTEFAGASTLIPVSPAPEMRFRSAGASPPRKSPVSAEGLSVALTRIPAPPTPSATRPEGSVPMKFPATVFDPPESSRRMPSPGQRLMTKPRITEPVPPGPTVMHARSSVEFVPSISIRCTESSA